MSGTVLPMVGSLEIRLLGRFIVVREGEEIPASAFGGRLPRTLLRLLASRRGTFVSKDELADALWNERLPADPAGNLEVLVSRVRRAVRDPGVIVTGPGGYSLASDDRCVTDVEIVRDAVGRGRSRLAVGAMQESLDAFRTAVDRWSGEPLSEDVYAEWADGVRAEMQRLHLEALEGAAEAALALGQPAQAVQMSEMALVREPLRERTHLLLVEALAVAGDRAAALRAFGGFRERLAEELGLDPSPEAFELQRRILQGRVEVEDRALQQLVGVAVDPDGTGADLRGALGGTGSGPARARALAAMAHLAAGSDDYARAGRLANAAVVEAGDDPGARAEALLASSIVDMNLGSLERAKSRLGEALGLFERLGDRHGVARVVDVRAMETFLAGHVAEAIERFDRVAQTFEEAGDLIRVVTPRSTLGHGLVFMARPAEGLAHIERALELARGLGDREAESYALWHRSEALAALARPDEAVESAEEALRIAEDLKHREWTAAALIGVGVAVRAAGDLVRTEAAFRRSLDLSEGMPIFRSWAAGQLARVLTARGRLDEARPLVDLAVTVGTPLSLFVARLAHVELSAASRDPEAASLAREALEIAEREGFLQGTDRLREIAET